MNSLRRLTAAVPVCLVLAGCPSSGDRPDTYATSGTIKFAGAPLADATVMFTPNDGQRIALGRTNANGEYSLTTFSPNDGAMEGNYTVLVRKAMNTSAEEVEAAHTDEVIEEPQAGGGGHDAGEDQSPESVLMVPPKYSNKNLSDLSAKVTADGENVFNFELK